MTTTNRGKSFEDLIEFQNEQYANKGRALIQKIATPTKVIRRYDPSNERSKIVGAFHEKKSTVDFIGPILGGQSVAFDAKSTMNRNGFNLSMVEPHQWVFLRDHAAMGGRSFLLVEFSEYNEIFRLGIEELDSYIEQANRKSVPFPACRKYFHRVQAATGYVLDYLANL